MVARDLVFGVVMLTAAYVSAASVHPGSVDTDEDVARIENEPEKWLLISTGPFGIVIALAVGAYGIARRYGGDD